MTSLSERCLVIPGRGQSVAAHTTPLRLGRKRFQGIPRNTCIPPPAALKSLKGEVGGNERCQASRHTRRAERATKPRRFRYLPSLAPSKAARRS
jgi:hypothetical protein